MSELYKLNKDMLIKLIGSIQEELEFYAVFETAKDRQGLWFHYLKSFTTIQKAQAYVNKIAASKIVLEFCKEMNEDNNFTYIGHRDQLYSSNENGGWGIAGYVIEKQKLNI